MERSFSSLNQTQRPIFRVDGIVFDTLTTTSQALQLPQPTSDPHLYSAHSDRTARILQGLDVVTKITQINTLKCL